ncbi:hypothetical protein BDF19DRAFT_252079 [Syncephalis fuscata]|nr:hypothetical protein BDF19DRAFT_252079 [Syncephalis fuscata]
MSVTTPLYSLHIRLSHYGRVRRLFYPCPNEVTVTKIKQDFRLFFRAPFGTADDIVVNDDENLQKVIEICNPDQGDLAKQTCCYLNLIVEQLSTSNSHLGYNGSTNVSQTTLTTDVPTKGDLAAVEDQLSMIYKKINELGESIASNAYSRSSDSTATATTTTTAMPQLDTSVMIDELGGVPNSQLFLLEQQALELAAEIREKSQRIVNGATDIASVIASASAVAAVTAAERAASSEPAPTVDNNDREEQLSVMCDGCGELVDGHWYHCMHCSDFDFCQSCYSSLTVRQHHPMHHGFKRTEQARTTAPVPCPTPSAPPAN